jgi:inositol monophosphatase 3
MWPYAIRVNVTRVMLLILFSVAFYILYTISSPSQLKRIPIPAADESRDLADDAVIADSDGGDPFQVNLKQLLIACIQAAEAGGHEVYRIRKGDGSGQGLDPRSKGLTREGAKEMVTKGDLASHTVMVHGLAATFPGLQIISEESHEEDETEQVVKSFHSHTDPLILPEELHSLPHDMRVPMKQVTVWIDPLDATQEYTEVGDDSLLDYVTTMVCVALNGMPVMGVIHRPFHKETFWGWKSFGTSGSLTTLNQHRTAALSNRSKEVVIVSRSHSGQVDSLLRSKLPDAQIVHAGGAGYKILQVIGGQADAYVHNTLIKKWDICAPNALIESVGGRFSSLTGISITYSGEEADVRHESGVLAAASFSQHQKFFSKLKSHVNS